MDILKILTESVDSLYPEDLDVLETELDTGDYSVDYIRDCKKKIVMVRKWLSQKKNNTSQIQSSTKVEKKQSVISKAKVVNKLPHELFLHDLICIRNSYDYKKKFRSFIVSHDFVDVKFIDSNIEMFEPWELGSILSFKQMGEPFLEKYFDALDPIKISRYQQFSEQFFMKHFSQLDATIVLTKGKNAWRKKENRSKQLDVFLRLKGIKI